MMKLLLPILLAVVGTGLGVGAGIMLKPEAPEMADNPCGDIEPAGEEMHEEEAPPEDGAPTHEYVKLNNQFVIPVVRKDRVGSLVVMSLSVEVPVGRTDVVYDREPKLRDMFLQVLFEHANVGGFDGTFTSAGNMDVLRRSLLETVHREVGTVITDVLITDIVRQDV